MIKPLGDRVLVKVEDAKEVTKFGLILTNPEERHNQGKVIAIGADVAEIKVDDLVIFTNGEEVELTQEKYNIVEGQDILAIIE